MLPSSSLDLNQYDAILFDFDGTLAPCLDLRSMKRAVVDFTVEETQVDRAQIESMLALELIDFSADWFGERGGDADSYRVRAHALIRQIEMDAAAETSVYDGATDVLGALQEHSIGVGIVTRNCESAVRAMFPEVDQFCSALYTRDHVEHLKPDPRHLLACINKLGCAPTAALMVGDGILDMHVAIELDMDRIGVLGGHNSGADLNAAGATWIVPSVRDLINYL